MTAIEEMLSKYSLDDEDRFRQAFKETMQEVVLCGLSRGGFFEVAAFTGGTALRIIHGIRRFSEDLDFSLLRPDAGFSFEKYLPHVQRELNANGFDIEIGKISARTNVRSAFIKADTYKLIFQFLSVNPDVFHINKTEKIRVKLEIDTNPPEGANYEESTRILPSPYIVKTMDIPSMFALKCHALMCRNYIKGRDYFDYRWFLERSAAVNEKLLENALFQTEGKKYSVTDITARLRSVFETADVKEAKKDVRRFLETPEILDKWSNVYFSDTVKNLKFV